MVWNCGAMVCVVVCVCVCVCVCVVVFCRHVDDVHLPSERSMAQLRVQMEIIGQLEAQVGLHRSQPRPPVLAILVLLRIEGDAKKTSRHWSTNVSQKGVRDFTR